mgnify:CR=1 FL=1
MVPEECGWRQALRRILRLGGLRTFEQCHDSAKQLGKRAMAGRPYCLMSLTHSLCLAGVHIWWFRVDVQREERNVLLTSVLT